MNIARHYVRELIYGANDGIVTTFAVVAGVAGGGLSMRVVLIMGAANLFADGVSIAAGLELLALGTVVAALAYGSGKLVAAMVDRV